MRQEPIYRELARERIEKLFALADEYFDKKPQLANRYVDLAKRIGMKCRVKIPPHLKMRICKQCGSFLVSGANSRVRTRPDGKGRVVITCLNCWMIKRYPMKREKLKRRRGVRGSAKYPQ